MKPMRPRNCEGDKGQAAVFITILLLFALIALAALAIDGGHLYVVRRDLQNMADAACLAAATEMALGGEEAAAIQAAKDYIIRNGGEFFSVWPEERPNEGSGTELTWGVEVAGADVRVALETVVDTYLTMIFNRHSAGVAARARCNSTSGGHILPIAVRRYDEDTIPEPNTGTDFLANKLADSGWDPPCASPCDYRDDSDEDEWVGRYGLMTVYLPRADYVPIDLGKIDGGHLYTQTGTVRGDVPPGDGVLDGVLVLGEGVRTNSPGGEFKGFILLDARNVANGPVEYYNGASKQRDTNKDISMGWFGKLYPDPVPLIGDQLPVLSGADAKFAAKEMDKYFDVGDAFVAVVYSGYVWQRPQFMASLDPPDVNASTPVTPTEESPASYTISLEKVGPAAWPEPLNVCLDVKSVLSDPLSATALITPTCGILDEGGDTRQLTIFDAQPDRYVTAFIVEAYDSVLGLKSWAPASFRYGQIEEPDFVFYSGQPEYQVEASESLTIDLYTLGFGAGPTKKNLQIEYSIIGDTSGYCVPTIEGVGGKIDIRDGQVRTGSYTVRVSDELPEGVPPEGINCTIELTVEGKPQYNEPRSLDIDLRVTPYSPGEADLKTFVIVEGFAPFRVSYVDTNSVAAYAIGEIRQTPTEILGYQSPRLSAWSR